MNPSYTDYVKNLSSKWPGLKPLDAFLTSPQQKMSNGGVEGSIEYLEFYGDGNTRRSDAVVDGLIDKTLEFTSDDMDPSAIGLCILVEDIGPRVVKTLGEALNINPEFFCGHIERGGFIKIEESPPSSLMTFLPSHVGSQDFMSFHYQKPIDLGELKRNTNNSYELSLYGNSERPVRCLPALFGRHVGLVRSCFSILHKKLGRGRWICTCCSTVVSSSHIHSRLSSFLVIISNED